MMMSAQNSRLVKVSSFFYHHHLENHRLVEGQHPPTSLDQTLSDFYFFSKLKIHYGGKI